MSTTTDPIEEREAPSPDEEPEERSTRRLLVTLLVILGLAALALLVLLLWLLRPATPAPPPGQPAGYPIQVITTIYGYGQASDQLLKTPLGASFDADGNVWISDTGQSRVEEYTNGGDYIRTIGESGDGRLYSPFGIAIDQERSLVYVADMGNHAVQIFSTDGGYVGQIPSPDQKGKVFGRDGFIPYDVELYGGRVIVASANGLYWFDQDGRVVAYWGGSVHGTPMRGDIPGFFNFPDSFVVDQSTGWVYVADSANRRVVAIDQDGIVRWVSGTPDTGGKITSFWQLPRSITIGPDGNLYVVDTFRFNPKGMGTGHIVVLSKDGELLSEFGAAGTADGDFNYPEQISTGPDGLWAIADRENNRVVVFKLITPYPQVDDLLAHRYPDSFSKPDHAWVTPPPTPPELNASASASP